MVSKNPLSRKDNIVVQEFNDEVLIYDLKRNKAFCLNETSAMVWQACDGKNSIPEIRQQLSEKFKKPISEDLVWLAIDGLKKDSLLENGKEIETIFEGLSRREVIRRVGFASVVALPVIASLVAPTALNAASLGGTGAACVTNSNCASNNCTSGMCCASTGMTAPGSNFACTTPSCSAPFCCSGAAALAACCSGTSSFVSCTPPVTTICTCT